MSDKVTPTIEELTSNLVSKLVSNDVFIIDEYINEISLFLDHYINDHRITEYNLNRLIDGFRNIKIHHTTIQDQCEYFSLDNIDNQCLLSHNWGKQKDWNILNKDINVTVFKYFSSSTLHFIDGFYEEITELVETNDINSKSIVLINNKPKVNCLVSSKFLSIDELTNYSKNYDLIIHGMSRILNPKDFIDNLIKLALKGIIEITIPDNKESETRLQRDFDKEATSNLMLLTGLIDVKIGKTLIKSEQQVLNYCAIASKTTSSAQLADIRKIQYEWIKSELEENKSLSKTMGHFKGSFNKIMTRAILVERTRNNQELLDFFKNNLQDKIALVEDKIIIECIKTSIKRAFKRLSEKLNVKINTLNKFFTFDQNTLLNGFKQLMKSVEIVIINCRINECDTQALTNFELCINHLKEAQNKL